MEILKELSLKGRILNYLHDKKVIRIFTITSIYLLLYVNFVSSDFISKGRKSFAFPNFLWNIIPKAPSYMKLFLCC